MKNGFISIGDNIFETLIAVSHQEQAKGLMGQIWMPPVMSFIYDRPKINKFWMRDTPSPLDILFCNNGEIKQIHKGEPYSLSAIGFDELSNLVIELPFGTAHSSNIKLGSKVSLIKPDESELRQIFSSSSHRDRQSVK